MKRHSEISLQTSDPLSHGRSSAVSQPVLDYYFELLKKTLEVNGLMDKPNRIYNMDESGICFLLKCNFFHPRLAASDRFLLGIARCSRRSRS